MATYVNNLRLTELATGEGSGTWGTTTNTNLELIGEALGYGSEAVANASTHTITVADGTADSARSFYLKLTGGGQACTVTLAPNTLSKVWMVENTTNSTLTFSQGSGANVAIAAGAVKMIATDGAGSGAVVYDLLVDTDLTGTTTVVNLTSSGTIDAATVEFNSLSGTGSVAITDILDQDNMSSNSATALATQQSIKAYVDSSVASFDTLAEVLAQGNTTGSTDIEVTTAQKVQFRDSAIYINSSADGQLDIVADTEIQIAATTIDANGNLDVSGTIAAGGVVTANAGVVVDQLTIDGGNISSSSGGMTISGADDITLDAVGDVILSCDGDQVKFDDGTSTRFTFNLDSTPTMGMGTLTLFENEIDVSSGNLTLDVAGDIILDADGGDIQFKDNGTEFGRVFGSSNNFYIQARQSDKDIIFQGIDGSSTISALTLDMSAGGTAIFNDNVGIGQAPTAFSNWRVLEIKGGSAGAMLNYENSSSARVAALAYDEGSTLLRMQTMIDADITLEPNNAVALTLDGSQNAQFAGVVTANAGVVVDNFTLDGTSLTLSTGNMELFTSGSNHDILFKGSDGGSTITALTLDMSANGNATFLGTVNSGASNAVGIGGTPADVNAGELGPGYLNLSRDDVASRKMIQFGSNGALLGSIFSGHGGTQVGIGASTTGITFNPSTRSMMPANPTSTNPQLDATLDIGFSSVRWKDLYLSGGVFLGGTGTANKLDDYEEGTWSPVWVGSTSTQTTNMATYTKIGNIVHLNLYISNISPATSSDQQLITGLPFTVAGSNFYGAGSIAYSAAFDVEGIGVLAHTNSTYLYFHYVDGTSGSSPTRNDWNGIASSGLALIMSISYRTDA